MNPNVPNDSPLWLCLHFKQLPLEVFTRGIAKDELEKPIVVLERHRICRMNDAARDIGIALGNNMDTAYTLSDKVTSFERDEAKEYDHLCHLAQWVYRYTSNIAIKAPDSLILDIAGSLKLFNGLSSLLTRIHVGMNTLGYEPAIGINRTPLASLVCAKSRCPGTEIEGLHTVPLSFLPVEEKILEAIGQMGIANIGELLALPKSGLARRFGVFFTDCLARLAGTRPDPQKFISPEPRFSSEITFFADVTNAQGLVFPVKRLIVELCDFLTARQLRVNYLAFRLAHRSHPPRTINIYLANPENDATVFLPLTQLKLDQIDDVVEIDSIRLTIERFFPADASSGDLFHGTAFHQKDGRMNDLAAKANATQLLNLLNTRLGPGTCYGLSAANDHRPEKAWRALMPGEKAKPVQPQHDNVEQNPRPVFLLDTPRPLYVISGEPCLGGRLTLLKGPERIDFGWWDESEISKPIARDYYIARQASGALFWIFNSADAGNHKGWYLHGIFS